MGVMLLCVVAIDIIPWMFGYELAKKGYIKHAIISFICALAIPVVFVYLTGNPSDWFHM